MIHMWGPPLEGAPCGHGPGGCRHPQPSLRFRPTWEVQRNTKYENLAPPEGAGFLWLGEEHWGLFAVFFLLHGVTLQVCHFVPT